MQAAGRGRRARTSGRSSGLRAGASDGPPHHHPGPPVTRRLRLAPACSCSGLHFALILRASTKLQAACMRSVLDSPLSFFSTHHPGVVFDGLSSDSQVMGLEGRGCLLGLFLTPRCWGSGPGDARTRKRVAPWQAAGELGHD